MKKITSAILCLATVLSLGGCKKDPTPSPEATTPTSTEPSIQIGQEIPDHIQEAISKTVALSSFHMTMSMNKGATEQQFDLKVNGYASDKITACGTVTSNDQTDSFSVNQGDYCLLKTDGTLITGQLDVGYAPCEALNYCDLLFQLLTGEAVSKGTTIIKSETDVSFLLSSDDFSKVWGMTASNGVSLDLFLSSEGYITDAQLWVSLEDVSVGYLFKFEDHGAEQDITYIHTPTVTEEQWNRAFAASAFENVTVTRYYDDRTKEKPYITLITPSVSAKTLRSEMPDSEGKITQLDGISYYYQFGAQFYEMETGTNTLPDGTKTSHYKLVPTDKYKGDTPGSLAAHLNSTFGFADKYSSISYDEDSQSYQISGIDGQWQYNTALTFNCGRLMSIVHTLIDPETGEVHTINSYYFSNYGTTSVSIPSVS